ncbi:MAG: ATP-dependent helicase [bacterium]
MAGTERKIKRLQKIAESIETKVIKLESTTVQQNKFTINYQKELNQSQYFAATTINGPLLVIAGAGSGKTRTLTYRVSYLIENNIDPSGILLLTFTRKAAQEMISRTMVLLKSNKAQKIMGGTFHSTANHILRKYSKFLNISPNFSILDTTDSQDIIALIRDDQKFDKKEIAFPKKGRIQGIISKSRNCRIPITKVIEKDYSALSIYIKEIELINRIYQKYKKSNNLFDYDDLVDSFIQSLKENQHFKEIIQNTYHYVMVDEYQDTNIPQKELVDLISAKHKNIMVVGDDSQSIYSFRGANYENILTFPERYPDCRVVKIEENYRSNQGILNFTNALIHHAKIGYKKKLFSKNTNNFKPVYQKFDSQEGESEYIVDKILQLREKGIELNQIAVLYRATYHGNHIQAELVKRNIPYVVVGGIKFIERKHVRDIIAFLRIALNPYDAVSWHRILKLVYGIGEITAKKIISTINRYDGQLNFSEYSKNKFYGELVKLKAVIEEIVDQDSKIPNKIEIIKAYYAPILKSQETDYKIRLLDIDFLYNLGGKYDSLEKFLSDFALDPPSNKFQNYNQPLIDETEDKPLTLSTVHSAKGLEWHSVFIPHLLDGLFPSVRSMNNMEELEEERRLFYVACTRAKEQLYLTMPSYFSSWDAFFTLPSRFLVEIDKKFYQKEKGILYQ